MPDALDCVYQLFADDTKLYSSIKNYEDQQKLQDNLFNACNWADKWQNQFNIKKCKTMHLGNGNNNKEYVMKENNKVEQIQKVNEEKDLGVIFDDNLIFNKHIGSKVKIANRNLGLIFKNFTFMNKEIFLQLYKSMVRPHLEYA